MIIIRAKSVEAPFLTRSRHYQSFWIVKQSERLLQIFLAKRVESTLDEDDNAKALRDAGGSVNLSKEQVFT